MGLRWLAIPFLTVLLAACGSARLNDAWLTDDGSPWVGPDGQCVQLRPLKPHEQEGFCYDVQTGKWQHVHHYEAGTEDELGFMYHSVDPTTVDLAQAPTLAIVPPMVVPANTIPVPPSRDRYVTPYGFEFNSAHLSAGNRRALNTLVKDWQQKQLQVAGVVVTGHTDPSGPTAYNILLSRWRAESVGSFFRTLGVPQNQILTQGAGEVTPEPGASIPAQGRYAEVIVFFEWNAEACARLAVR